VDGWKSCDGDYTNMGPFSLKMRVIALEVNFWALVMLAAICILLWDWGIVGCMPCRWEFDIWRSYAQVHGMTSHQGSQH
jgi:hypothetical protein